MVGEEMEPLQGSDSEEAQAAWQAPDQSVQSQTEPIDEKQEHLKQEIQYNLRMYQNLGIEVDEGEIKKAIEDLGEKAYEGWNIAIPKNLKLSEIWQKMKERYPEINFSSTIADMDAVKMPRHSFETYAVNAPAFKSKPDADSIGSEAKAIGYWESTRGNFMTPLELLATEARTLDSDRHTHLDENYLTACPNSKDTDDRTVVIGFKPVGQQLLVTAMPTSNRGFGMGIRRVNTIYS